LTGALLRRRNKKIVSRESLFSARDASPVQLSDEQSAETLEGRLTCELAVVVRGPPGALEVVMLAAEVKAPLPVGARTVKTSSDWPVEVVGIAARGRDLSSSHLLALLWS
jgi:hypothetical protein